MSFFVNFSGLISQFRILEKSYQSPRIFNVQIYIWSLFKAKLDLWCPDEAFRITLLQRYNQFYGGVVFFAQACNKKFERANATAIVYDANKYPPDDWLTTGWAGGSQTRTWLVDSLICITFSLENNVISVLHYVINVALHYYMLHRFEIFFNFFCLWNSGAWLYEAAAPQPRVFARRKTWPSGSLTFGFPVNVALNLLFFKHSSYWSRTWCDPATSIRLVNRKIGKGWKKKIQYNAMAFILREQYVMTLWPSY